MAQRSILALCLLTLALAGCTGFGGNGCSGSQGSGGQSGVCNQKDSFAYGGQVGAKSGSESYNWENSGTSASVSWGGQGSGSLSVTILDGAGHQVYSRSFSGSGQGGASERTATGQAGTWKVQLNFGGFSGQMGLAVNKA